LKEKNDLKVFKDPNLMEKIQQ